MKHIVYLDERRLRSFYAQAFDGLEDYYMQSELYEKNDTKEIHSAVRETGYEGQLSLPSIAKGTARETVTDARKDTHYTNREQTTDSVKRALHDNALVRAIDFAKDADLLTNEESAVSGKYILVVGAANMLDFSYYSDSIDEDQMNFMAKLSVSKTMESVNTSKPTVKQLEENRRKDDFIKNIKNGLAALNFMRKLFPFESVCFINKCVIPMKNEFFVENYGQRLLLYDGNITVFGRVTKISEKLFDDSSEGVFGGLNRSIYKTIQSMWGDWGIKIGKSVFISPIAAFYE